MSHDHRNAILASIRKNGVFSYNRFSPYQSSRYGPSLEDLQAKELIVCEKLKPSHWQYTKGPKWSRRG